jgi:hypothetical protein
MAAQGLIDSVRSAMTAFRQLSDSVVFIGQSQGSRAVLFASLVAQQYAPLLGSREPLPQELLWQARERVSYEQNYL